MSIYLIGIFVIWGLFAFAIGVLISHSEDDDVLVVYGREK